MIGETIAIVQGKVYLYHEEIVWLLDIIDKQKTHGTPAERVKSAQMIETLQDLRERTK